ncbi:MAG: heparan-alpha-glucosaminide N-acetyltransferase [Caldilineaceae bacterium]
MALSTAVVADNSARPTTNRYWEIDTLRGVAIVMMVIFHLMWDLVSFGITPNVVLYAGFWKYFQRTTAISFLLLVGVSLTVSYWRAKTRHSPGPFLFPKFFWRGLRIFAVGMGFTLIAWATGFGYVHFGVLHLIGVAIILAYPLIEYRWVNLGSWALFFWLGGAIRGTYLDHNWLDWLGFHTRLYAPLDYFPLIPWFGVVLLGVAIGNTLYTPQGRILLLPDRSHWAPVRLLQWLGRRSLLIYVIHQPILLALLFALGLANY